MTGAQTIQLWTGGDCAGPPGYGYGGWAWLAVQGSVTRGWVGGERHTTTGAMAVRGLIEGLKAAAAEPGVPLQLDPGDMGLARIAADAAGRKAAGWRTVEGEAIPDPDLWDQAAKLIAARTAPIRFGVAARSDARVFVGAWTDFARDRCRDKGAFTSAIPKPNLTTFMAKRAPA